MTCEGCGANIPSEEEAMGYNFGGRPEYLCQQCCPQGDAETIIASIKAFMGRPPSSSDTEERK